MSDKFKRIKIETDLQANPTAGDMVWMTATTKAAVQAALDAANGKATAFTVHYANDIYHLLLQAERYLADNGIPVSDRAGATVTMTPAGPSANAYKNAAISPRVALARSGTGWYLTGVERVDVWPRNPKKFAVTISDRAADALVRRTLAAFGRKPEHAEQTIARAA